MAHSPYTSTAVEFVERNPGCCKYDLASHLTYDHRRDPSKQYYLVNTQIRLGNIVAVAKRGRYELYTPGQYKRLQLGLAFDTPDEIVADYEQELSAAK